MLPRLTTTSPSGTTTSLTISQSISPSLPPTPPTPPSPSSTEPATPSSQMSTTSSSDSLQLPYQPPHTTSTPSGSANICTRAYIYHLPHPLPPNTPVPYTPHLPSHNPLKLPPQASEPTDTLVLTSPQGVFVDIRVLRDFGEQVYDAFQRRIVKVMRLEWAFAGLGESQFISEKRKEELLSELLGLEVDGDNGEESSAHDQDRDEHGRAESEATPTLRHATWHHWIDSRYPVGYPDIPVDTGIMYPMTTSPALTLEVGAAKNPFTGKMQCHEEMWEDKEIKTVWPNPSRVCVVLWTQYIPPPMSALGMEEPSDDGVEAVRGVIVRVGQYVQGIMKRGNLLTVERWEFVEEHEKGKEPHNDVADGQEKEEREEAESGRDGRSNAVRGKWTRAFKIGPDFLPCVAAQEDSELRVGGLVKAVGLEWQVGEYTEW
ncbi:hypothetical protein M011DRAFT_467054 [Sporormia fimetaria CBS 119925]|uniref:Uncharacterized protein n=1 Tax=Sporormia fimetaria CBS 119925 TaxID=1340428 RepID=A0A6A6VBT3_9PLEO|nr:hypothetical protein M011DRAFT_467054 [Sporormia fimetaria CBS 119925]